MRGSCGKAVGALYIPHILSGPAQHMGLWVLNLPEIMTTGHIFFIYTLTDTNKGNSCNKVSAAGHLAFILLESVTFSKPEVGYY